MSRPVILITGAAKGIGLEAARLLRRREATVIIAARDVARAGEEAAACGAESVELDLRDEASVQSAVEAVRERHGRLDVLVNNAAILLDRAADAGEISLEMVRETLETNLLGTWRVTQAFLPLLRKSGAPRIVNVSSRAGQLSDPGNWAPAYSVSKTALNGLTTQLALSLPDFAVNAVSPGWCRTTMGGEGAPRTAAEGADSIVWVAVEAPQSLTGKFIHDREPIAW